MTFFVHGIAVPKGSVKAFIPKGWNRAVLTSASGPKLKDWNRSIAVAALEARGQSPVTAEAVAVDLIFYLPRPKAAKKRVHCTVRPDVDKLCRAVLDPMIGIVFEDDSQVVRLAVQKQYISDTIPPGVQVTVEIL